MAKFSIRYRPLAQDILVASYSLSNFGAYSLATLLELAGSEEQVEYILSDDLRKRSTRLANLEKAVDEVLLDYKTRRLRCPLEKSRVAQGDYVTALLVVSGEVLAEDHRPFSLTPELADALLGLTPIEFEELCGAVLHLTGCRNITVTQSSKDDGVDAIAEIPMNEALKRNSPLHRLAGDLSFLVYSQAKRYSLSNPVDQDTVLALEGSWRAMRNAYHNNTAPAHFQGALKRADFRAADPVLLVLITSGRYTKGALTKGKALGMILLDGEQVAQLLIEGAQSNAMTPSGAVALLTTYLEDSRRRPTS